MTNNEIEALREEFEERLYKVYKEDLQNRVDVSERFLALIKNQMYMWVYILILWCSVLYLFSR